MVVVLWFLSRPEMGVATLAWSVAVILEAFNGLGIGTAVLQAKSIDEEQFDSVFWYSTGVATLVFVAITLAAPSLAVVYEEPELQWMIIVSALKLPLVGAALVPLQRLNRDLKFRHIGGVQTGATLFSAVIKIALAAADFGAWALVVAHTAHGLSTLALAAWAEPWRPRLRFVFGRIAGLAHFGLLAAASSIVYHFYRNADYLVVGTFLGKEALGLYRVAFDVAMTPAIVLLQVVNRASFPVFARLGPDRTALAAAFWWSQRNLALLVLPVVIFLAATGDALLETLGGADWAPAGPLVAPLALAAWIRCHAQVFPQVFHAVGRPLFALYDSMLAMVVLGGGFVVAGAVFGNSVGVVGVCWAWLLGYPIILAMLTLLARREIPLTLAAAASTARHPSGLLAVLSCLGLGIWALGPHLPSPALKATLGAAVIFGGTLGYVRGVMGLRLKELTLDAR
jgi:O-antigen/teichoic acid export membrane protein